MLPASLQRWHISGTKLNNKSLPSWGAAYQQLPSNAESIAKISVCKLPFASHQVHAPCICHQQENKMTGHMALRPCETLVHDKWNSSHHRCILNHALLGPQNLKATRGSSKNWWLYLDGWSISLYIMNTVILRTLRNKELQNTAS
jgi:hypothetical protein